VVTCEFVPLIVPPRSHLISQAPEGNLSLDITGTIGTGYRIATVMAEPRSADAEAKAAVLQGAPTADVFMKPAEGKAIADPSLRRYVPARIRKT
jgi:hypothetical protein